MINRLDISSVRVNSNRFFKELDKLQGEGLSLLFRNCILNVRIGLERVIVTQIDTCLYNEDKNSLLLIENGNSSIQELKQILNKKGLSFHEVFYHHEGSYGDGCKVKPVYFVKDIDSLEQIVKGDKKSSSCTFYPKMDIGISIKYHDNDEIYLPLEEGDCNGLVNFEDRFVFLLKPEEKVQISSCDITTVFVRNKVKVKVENNICPVEITKKIRSKTYEEKFRNIRRNYKIGS